MTTLSLNKLTRAYGESPMVDLWDVYCQTGQIRTEVVPDYNMNLAVVMGYVLATLAGEKKMAQDFRGRAEKVLAADASILPHLLAFLSTHRASLLPFPSSFCTLLLSRLDHVLTPCIHRHYGCLIAHDILRSPTMAHHLKYIEHLRFSQDHREAIIGLCQLR